jgi:hypothetical protein
MSITNTHNNTNNNSNVNVFALSQIHVHTKGYSTLHGRISKRVLPSEYGGENGSLIDHWCK